MTEATPTEALKELIGKFNDGGVARVYRGESNAVEQKQVIAALKKARAVLARVAEQEKADAAD